MNGKTESGQREPDIKSVKVELTGPSGKDMLKAAFAFCCFKKKRAQAQLRSHVKMSACDAEGNQSFSIAARTNLMIIYIP